MTGNIETRDKRDDIKRWRERETCIDRTKEWKIKRKTYRKEENNIYEKESSLSLLKEFSVDYDVVTRWEPINPSRGGGRMGGGQQ